MSNEDIEKEIAEQLEIVVARWCPDTFNRESFKSRTIRALLEVNAYMINYDMVKKGKEPIRKSFPIDLPDFKKKENPEQLRQRMLDYMKTDDTKKMVDSVVEQTFASEYPGEIKYTHSFDIQELRLAIKTDHINRVSLKEAFIKRLPLGIMVEVYKID